MSATRKAPVLMIGLDAAQVTLVEQWMADGTMPHLAALRARGAYGRLASMADWLVGSPWPTFYTSSGPADHGFFNYLQWRPERMTHERPSAAWLPLRPFWRELSAQQVRTVAIDVPVTYPPAAFDGVELSAWSSHDKLWPPSSHPPSLLREVYREFGASPIDPEISGLQRVIELLRLRDQLVASPRRVTTLALSFLERYPWDLALLVLGATHRGGHKLWDDSGVLSGPSPGDRPELAGALREVYRACDEGVGRVLAAAPRETNVLVFALHGMGPNDSRDALLPGLVDAILGDPAARQQAADGLGLFPRIRKAIPVEWRSAVKGRLPQRMQDRLALYWRKDEHPDWSHTRAFTTVGDKEGHVRVNLKGREAQGVVEPPEYEHLLAALIEGLESFVDEDTGAPIVDRIARPAELWSAGANLDRIADLIVRWVESPACTHRAVVSPRYGRIAWPTPGKNPDGRSGHHRSTGWLIAAGPDARPGATIPDAHILDLAPTALALLHAKQPYAMRGRVLSLVD